MNNFNHATYSYTTAAIAIVLDGRASLSSLSRLSIELLSYLLILQPPYTAFTQTTRNDYKVQQTHIFFTPQAWVHFLPRIGAAVLVHTKQPYTQTQYTRHTIIARGSSRTASNLSRSSHSPAETSATSVQIRFLGVVGGRYDRCVEHPTLMMMTEKFKTQIDTKYVALLALFSIQKSTCFLREGSASTAGFTAGRRYPMLL